MMEKGPRKSNQIVAIFLFVPMAAILDFKMAAFFSMVLAYISSSEPQNELKIIAIPMFVIAIKALCGLQ